MKRMPTTAASGARVLGLKKFSQAAAEAFRSSRRMICPVTVVPTLAPRMMPRDCLRVMTPAATRPEVRTMVAVELWMMAVALRPRKKAPTGLVVSFSMADFSAPEEPCSRPRDMSRIP